MEVTGHDRVSGGRGAFLLPAGSASTATTGGTATRAFSPTSATTSSKAAGTTCTRSR
jgi:hypothetical protein